MADWRPLSGWRLYWRYVGQSLRAQLQYRGSVVLLAVGHFLITGGEFLAVWALLDRFGSLRGWSLAEVGVFYGLVSIAFATAEAVVRGFDVLPGLVKSGSFDRLLLRPRSVTLQVIGHELQLLRLGRWSQGVVVLAWSVAALQVDWTVGRVLLALWTVIGGACLFSGLFIAQAALSFWTTETLELINILTYGGVETAQFPLSVYRPWFRAFFTFVVPLACVSYFPGLAIVGRPHDAPTALLATAPAAGLLFLGASLLFWRHGLRHYTSTGS
ncbi:MAG: ABC-2 family transporter protein [Fimbriimonadaceae bacterium]|nr:ABC-2 family transporter protein [Fimbriimonadaceae bacterium]